MKEFPLFISRKLRDKLNLIDHKISLEILDTLNNEKRKFPISFLDIDENDPTCLTFIQANKAAQIFNVTDEKLFEDDCFMNDIYYIDETHDVWTKYRSKIKIGRLVNLLYPNKFENSSKGSQNKNDIESFINLYKAMTDRDYKFSLIDIVSGDKIGYWYNYKQYANNDMGSIANSCMKSVNKIYYNIYMKNPESVSLVIMYSDDTKSKIKARALLWKLQTPEGRFFMDRVYTNDYSDEQIFIDFAKKNNWLYKSSQSMGYNISIIDPEKSENNNERIDMFVKINPFRFRKFPYFDTLCLMNTKKLLLGNNFSHTPDRNMTHTDGGFQRLEIVFSKYYNDAINKSEAIYCQIDRDWVYKSDAVKVYNSNEKYAIKDSSKIVYMTFRTNGKEVYKPFLKTKCVWSDYLKTWIYHESVVNVYLNLDKTEVGIDHKRRLGHEIFEVDGDYYADFLFNKTKKRLLTVEEYIKKNI